MTAIPDPLDDTMSLSSLREDGLFTGEEISLKFGPNKGKILTLLVETDDNTDEEDSIVVASVADESQSLVAPFAKYSQQDYQEELPPGANEPGHLLSGLSMHVLAGEAGDEGVNTILIEHGATITTTESHIGHIIPSSQPKMPAISGSKPRRSRISFMKRAVIKLKHVLGYVKASGSANTASTFNTNPDNENRHSYSLPTPRAAQTIEEAESQHFREVHSSPPPTAATTNETPPQPLTTNNFIEHTTSAEFHVSLKEKCDKIPLQHSISAMNKPKTNDDSNECVFHTQMQLHSRPSTESEQFDQTYQGPYDDNKSFVTYSTGDFDISQMYSRSWSTIAPPTMASKASTSYAPIEFGRSRSEMSLNSRLERVVIMNPSFSSKKDKDCTGDYNIMVVPVEKSRYACKEEDKGVSFDGLSLIDSVVGDDRSYVEDY